MDFANFIALAFVVVIAAVLLSKDVRGALMVLALITNTLLIASYTHSFYHKLTDDDLPDEPESFAGQIGGKLETKPPVEYPRPRAVLTPVRVEAQRLDQKHSIPPYYSNELPGRGDWWDNEPVAKFDLGFGTLST